MAQTSSWSDMLRGALSPVKSVASMFSGPSGTQARSTLGSAFGAGVGALFGAPNMGQALGGLAGGLTQFSSNPSNQTSRTPYQTSRTPYQTSRTPYQTTQTYSPAAKQAPTSSRTNLTSQLNAMSAAYANNQGRLSTIAQQSQRQANAMRQQMGGYVDNAMKQSYDQNVAAQGVLRGMYGDPRLNDLINASMDQTKNPGFSQQAISTMKGNALSRNAASANAQARNAMGAAARYGMQGPARAYQQSMLKNRNAYQSSREQGDIDLNIEQQALQDRGRSMSQTASLMGMRNGYGSQLADLMTRYDPMRTLAAGQGIMQPFQQIGYGLGNAGFGGM